jgi:hypothetical protein
MYDDIGKTGKRTRWVVQVQERARKMRQKRGCAGKQEGRGMTHTHHALKKRGDKGEKGEKRKRSREGTRVERRGRSGQREDAREAWMIGDEGI